MKCSKNGYESENKARKVLKACEKKRNRKLRVYQCEKCWRFHLTSTDKWVKPGEEEQIYG